MRAKPTFVEDDIEEVPETQEYYEGSDIDDDIDEMNQDDIEASQLVVDTNFSSGMCKSFYF